MNTLSEVGRPVTVTVFSSRTHTKFSKLSKNMEGVGHSLQNSQDTDIKFLLTLYAKNQEKMHNLENS